MLRPSLSEFGDGGIRAGAEVSPEFMLRPSLSEAAWTAGPDLPAGVAGVYAPAFVERAIGSRWATRSGLRVSPEFMLRPSLSDRLKRLGGCLRTVCRRSLCSGLR